MNRKFLTILSVAAGIVVTGAAFSDAEAGRRDHGYHGNWHGDFGHHKKRYYHRKLRGHYGYNGHDNFRYGCHHYLKKARYTGHRYWWLKYDRCMHNSY